MNPLISEAFAQTSTPAVPAGSATTAAPGTATATPAQPSMGSMLVPFALMFGVVYFLMIRPQQKRMKEQQKMLTELKYGDEIITSSGILGKIDGMAEKVVTLEIASNVKIKLLKSQIAQVVRGPIQDAGA